MSVAATPNPFQSNSNNELQIGQSLHLPKISNSGVNGLNEDDNNNNLSSRVVSRAGSMMSHSKERFRYNDSSLSFNK